MLKIAYSRRVTYGSKCGNVCVKKYVVKYALVALSAIALTYLFATPVAAHGVSGRSDLPLPLWQVAWASAWALIFSFAAVALFWSKPHLRAVSEKGWELPLPGLAIKTLAFVCKVIGFAALGVVVFAGVRGNSNPSVNIAPNFLYIVAWVGVAVMSMILGDVWRAFNPMSLIAKNAQRLFKLFTRESQAVQASQTDTQGSQLDTLTPQTDTRKSQAVQASQADAQKANRDHHWWAVAIFFGFVWLELAYHASESPRAVATFLIIYTAVMMVGGVACGLRWARNADGFGVLYRLFGVMGIFSYDGDGLSYDRHNRSDSSGVRLRARWPFADLTRLKVLPGTEALVLTALGATAFDGFTRTSFWFDLAASTNGWTRTAYHTAGLILVVGMTFIIYRTAIAVMAIINQDNESELADLFLPSLLPICVAYILAHYFSLMVIEGQRLIALASDPFGWGWDILGTARYQVNSQIVSTDVIAWVQIAAIVLGHIFAVVVAHDMAVERYPAHSDTHANMNAAHADANAKRSTLHSRATISQLPMLVAMVLYTVVGLLLLLGL